MDFNTLSALLNKVGASYILWESAPPFSPAADPGASYHQRFGFTIGWSIHNTEALPSEGELQALLESQSNE